MLLSHANCALDPQEVTDLKEILFHNEYLLTQILCTYKLLSKELSNEPLVPQQAPSIPINLLSSIVSPRVLAVDMMFTQYIPPDNYRYNSMHFVLRLLETRNPQILVETGGARNGNRTCQEDGCSTVIFGNFAKIVGARLFSAENDKNYCREAQIAVDGIRESVRIVQGDPLMFLKSFSGGLIDFLYLDSFDFDKNSPRDTQVLLELQLAAVYDKLHVNSVVMIDDCRLPYGGKCFFVKEILLSRGWTLILSEYQQIFIYEKLKFS